MADTTISQLGQGTPTSGITVPWSDGTTTYQAKLSSLITAQGDMGNTGIQLPRGTDIQRVNTPGQIRFNITSNNIEFYDGSNWRGIISSNTSVLEVEMLLVGGGGGGGGLGGGGGAGGTLYIPSYSLTVGAYNITVGQGGAGAGGGAAYSGNGANGTNTVFNNIIIAAGGGGGGGYNTPDCSGSNGGCGGGAGAPENNSYAFAGGVTTGNTLGNAIGIIYSGNGGSQTNTRLSSVTCGRGGGGASGNAANGNPGSSPGAGANGVSFNILGTPYYFGGGGGGGAYYTGAAGATGGLGGGGGGGSQYGQYSSTGGTGGLNNGSNGAYSGGAGGANTGGGGGGGGHSGGTAYAGGAGGSGIVVIVYASNTQRATGGTIDTTSRPGYYIHKFTGGSGIFTVL